MQLFDKTIYQLCQQGHQQEFDKVEFSNNPTPACEPPVIITFDRPNCAKVPDSSVITGLTTHSARAKFASDRKQQIMSREKFMSDRQRPITSREKPASDRQQPIMSREALIMSPNYAPEFERSGDYASRSATLHKPSMDCRTIGQHVLSVKMTDKKSAIEETHCNCSTKPFTSCVNKDTSKSSTKSNSLTTQLLRANRQ